VVNSGGNSVETYFGSAPGVIDLRTKQSFFAGTNPVFVLIANVDGDAKALPDLVIANEGSNDVSILFGTGAAADATAPIAGWSTKLGPRLKVGQGPQSIVQTLPGKDVIKADGRPGSDGIPDLIVSNGLGNDTYTIPGTGSGFFNDGGSAVTGGLSGIILPGP